MTTDATSSEHVLTVPLDVQLYAVLQQTAAEGDRSPADLVAHWICERLAHEAERKSGRAREQRPRE